MKLNFLLVGIAVLAISSVATAQETIIPTPEQFQFVPEPNAPASLAFTGDAHYDSATGEYVLAVDRFLSNQNIRAFMKGDFQFCANKYTVSYEAFNGSRLTGGGDIRAGVYYGSNISDPQVIAEIDTFEDGYPCKTCTKLPWSAWEPNNNHIAIESAISNLGGGTNSLLTSPFKLISGDWQKVEIHYNHGDVAMNLDSGANSIRLRGKAEYRANTPAYLAISASTRMAWTNAANLLKIRNIKIEVLESCASSKTAIEALAELDTENVLNSCPISSEALGIISDGLSAYRSTGLINSSTHEEALNLLSNKLNFCNGSSVCKADLTSQLDAEYQKGFQAGVGSIDQDAIRKEGFDSGVASVPVDTIKSGAYNQGFDAGKNSVQCPVDSGNKEKEDKNKKVTVCHYAANGKGNTISISQNAVQAHLKHGDSLGECPKVEERSKEKSKK